MPILQQPLRPLDVSVEQQHMLPLDLSIQQQSLLSLDVAAWMCQFYSRLCCPVLQQPNSLCTSLFSVEKQTVLPLDVYSNQEPMHAASGLHGHICSSGDCAASEHVCPTAA
jgi:hypothetical protein